MGGPPLPSWLAELHAVTVQIFSRQKQEGGLIFDIERDEISSEKVD